MPLNHTTADLSLKLCAKVEIIRELHFWGAFIIATSQDPVMFHSIQYPSRETLHHKNRFSGIKSSGILLIGAPGAEQHKFIRDISTMGADDFYRAWIAHISA